MSLLLIISIALLVSCDLDQFDISWNKHFLKLTAGVINLPMNKTAVALAEDDNVLEAIKIDKQEGIADSNLVGDENKIKEIAK